MNQIINRAYKNRPMLQQICRAALVGLTAVMLAVVPVASTAATAQPPTVTHPVTVHRSEPPRGLIHQVNPHLHLNIATKGVPVDKKHEHSHERWHGHWHHYWAFYEWATIHRGLGTVEGTVRSAEGSPMAGVRVLLRHANGHPFRRWGAKHVTHTSEGGGFIMTRVRVGSYRVRAEKGKANAHISIHVNAGAMAAANIKM
jgi:hypothetical protein